MHRSVLDSSQCKSLACRGCLATDVDLYHIIGCGLKQSYEVVVGLPISVNDSYPQHLCRLCKEYILKYITFRKKCRMAHNLLKEAEESGRMLTTGFICAIDRPFYKLGYSLNSSDTTTITCYEPNEGKEQQSFPKKEVEFNSMDMINTDVVKSEIDEGNFGIDIHKVPIEFEKFKDPLNEDIEDGHEDTLKPDDAGKFALQENVDDNSKDIVTPAESVKSVMPTDKVRPRKVQSLTYNELVECAKAHNFEVTFFTEYEQFQHMEELKRKALDSLSDHYCHHCYRIFLTNDTLTTHMKNIHDPKIGEFICKFCKSRFDQNYRLNTHLQKHSVKYTCKECGVVTPNRNTMKIHYEGHTDVTYICHECGKGFPKKSSYTKHLKKHKSDVWCEFCGQSFTGIRGVLQHKTLIHRDVKNFEIGCHKCSQPFMYQTALEKHWSLNQCNLPACVHCGDSFDNNQLLKSHLSTHHKKRGKPPQKLECENCHGKFASDKARRRHEPDCSFGKSPCFQCGKTFDMVEQLKEHSKRHESDKFKCEKCSRNFTSAYYFRTHYNRCYLKKVLPVRKMSDAKMENEIDLNPRRRINSPTNEALIKYAASLDFDVKFLTKEEQIYDTECEKRKVVSNAFKCNFCGKHFRSQQIFSAHKQRHHDVSIGKHVCDICQMRYRKKYQLESHLRWHGSRFYCKKCEFVTKSRRIIKRHHAYHRRGTKFVCQFCGKDFLKMVTFKIHVRLRHAAESSWCGLCGESFKGDEDIARHKTIAHKDEPDAKYVCTSCNKAFLYKFGLNKHEGLKRCDLSSCVKCGEGFRNQQLLRYHLIQQHRNEAVSQELECETCKVRFLNVTALKRHAAECDDGQSPCVQCGKNFHTEQELKDHIQEQHNTDEEFKCEECNKSFTNAVFFRYHSYLHSKGIKRRTDDQDSGSHATNHKRSKIIARARNVRVKKERL